MSKKKTVVLLRWMVIIVTSILMIISRENISLLSPLTTIIYFLILSNIVLSFLPENSFTNKRFDYIFVLMDTILVTLGIYMTGNTSSEFYLVYFLIIIATTFSSDFRTIIRNTAIVSLVYAVMLLHGRSIETFIKDEAVLLRLPFLFIMSLFYGYMAEQTRSQFTKRVGLEEEKRKLQIILEITKSVSSTLDIKEVLKIIVNHVAEYIQADRCSIILADSNQKYGYVVASHDSPDIDRLQIDLEKYPEIFHALKRNEAIVIDDINTEPLMKDVAEVLNSINIKSLLVIPIAYQEEVIGTLFLKIRRKNHQFKQDEIKFCQVIANTSANALKNAQLYEQIKIQAKTDGLTNLLNHRSFIENYKEEVQRANRTQKPFSILMIDVDNFKSINDSHGHSFGDTVLTELAHCLKENTRSIDIVARYGGDEFICILPEASHDHGLMVARRILSKVREQLKDKGISISIGMATYFLHTDDSSVLLHLADQAMYLGKYKGGNQIFTFDPSDTKNMKSWNKKVFETFLVMKTLSRFDDSREITVGLTEQLKKMISVDSSPQSLYEIVTSLSSALDARDHYTNDHSERVINYSKRIANEVGMSLQQQDELAYLCLLHDIGKIGIPDHILNKPGRLTAEEFEIMKRHPEIGERIISPLDALQSLKPLIRHHQEYYDGKGYPDGLKGEAIPLACRILSVVDTFDAMTTDRPYRKALPVEAAMAELKRCAGSQFDPKIVEIFIRIYQKEEMPLKSSSM